LEEAVDLSSDRLLMNEWKFSEGKDTGTVIADIFDGVLTTVANDSITELLFIAGLSVPRNLKDVLCLIDKRFYRVEITPKPLLLPKFIEKSHISVAVDVNFSRWDNFS
jgi:hypothetical protein